MSIISKFRELDGDVYRIDTDERDFPVAVFKFENDDFIPVSGRLIPTLEYEGLPVEDPLLSGYKKIQGRNKAI